MQCCVQKERGPRLTSLNIYLIILYAQHHIHKTRGSRLTSLSIYLMLFTHAALRTKSKGLPIDAPYHLSYDFYLRSVAYKKQRTPDWRPLASILCFLHVQRHIQKVRGLPIDVSYHLILFICNANRSRLTYHRTSHTHQWSTYEK
jgi:hypothetical protein